MRKRAGRPGRDDRNFAEAVLWWRRTGAPWRDLPSDFGPWKTVFNRFDRWASKGIWCLPVIPSNGSRGGKLPYDKPAPQTQAYKTPVPPTVTYGPSGTGTGTGTASQ